MITFSFRYYVNLIHKSVYVVSLRLAEDSAIVNI